MKRLLLLCAVFLIEDAEASGGGRRHERTISESSIEKMIAEQSAAEGSRVVDGEGEDDLMLARWLDDSDDDLAAAATASVAQGDQGSALFNLAAADVESFDAAVSDRAGVKMVSGLSHQGVSHEGGAASVSLEELMEQFKAVQVFNPADYRNDEEFQKVNTWIRILEEMIDKSGLTAARTAELSSGIDRLKRMKDQICEGLDRIRNITFELQEIDDEDDYNRVEAQLEEAERAVEKLEKRALNVYRSTRSGRGPKKQQRKISGRKARRSANRGGAEVE